MFLAARQKYNLRFFFEIQEASCLLSKRYIWLLHFSNGEACGWVSGHVGHRTNSLATPAPSFPLALFLMSTQSRTWDVTAAEGANTRCHIHYRGAVKWKQPYISNFTVWQWSVVNDCCLYHCVFVHVSSTHYWMCVSTRSSPACSLRVCTRYPYVFHIIVLTVSDVVTTQWCWAFARRPNCSFRRQLGEVDIWVSVLKNS